MHHPQLFLAREAQRATRLLWLRISIPLSELLGSLPSLLCLVPWQLRNSRYCESERETEVWTLVGKFVDWLDVAMDRLFFCWFSNLSVWTEHNLTYLVVQTQKKEENPITKFSKVSNQVIIIRPKNSKTAD